MIETAFWTLLAIAALYLGARFVLRRLFPPDAIEREDSNAAPPARFPGCGLPK